MVIEIEENKQKQLVEDLTLLLICLNCWDENIKRQYSNEPILKSWKGYDFNVLDSLAEKGFIFDKKGSKTLCLSDKGVNRAKLLKDKSIRVNNNG